MNSLIITMMLLASATLIMSVPFNWFREFEDGSCVDKYPTEECKKHAATEGYCDYEKDFMEKNCALTCGFCQPQVPGGPSAPIGCKDEIEGCAKHAAEDGYCEYNADFMSKYCRKACRLCRQPIEGPNGKKFFWETKPWGECKQGVEVRGVKCIHVYQGADFQVDLRYCRDNLPNEDEPADQRVCDA